MSRVEELMKALEIAENKEQLKMLVESGKREKDALMGIASKLGFEVTEEELVKVLAKSRELDDEELEKVNGGIFWLGEDAPNGHEVGCLHFYYSTWDDYYSERDTGHCQMSYNDAFADIR